MTTKRLIDAIETGNLQTLQEILANFDERGVPRVDLNHGIYNAGTALIYALWQRPINMHIIQSLLDARDFVGNPIININHPGPHGQTVFSFILSYFFDGSAEQRRELLQRVLDVRGPGGELVANLQSDVANIPLLRQAAEKNDIHCLRILLDARMSDGSKALSVNEIKHRKTLLDCVLERNDNNQEMVDLIRREGGMCSRDILVPAPALIAAPATTTQLGRAFRDFNADQQNTHDPSVTQTAKASLMALNKTYGAQLDENRCVKEIADFILKYDYSALRSDLDNTLKKQEATDFLRQLQSKFTEVHSYTEFTIKKILALVWMGTKDNCIETFPEEIRRTFEVGTVQAPSTIIDTKKSSFIEKFIEAAREYKERGSTFKICTGGSIHKLIEVLNLAHVNVVITTGDQAVAPAATEMALSLVGVELRKQGVDNQNYILSHWDDDNEQVNNFRLSVTHIVEAGLKAHFGPLLTETKRKEIVSGLPDMPRPPVPHRQLNELVTEILNTVQKTGSQLRQLCVNAIHDLSHNIYYEAASDQKKYEQLQSEYESFKVVALVASESSCDLWLEPILEAIIKDPEKTFMEKKLAILTMKKLARDISEMEPFMDALANLIDTTVILAHKEALMGYQTGVVASIDNFKAGVYHEKPKLDELITELNRTIAAHTASVTSALEKEPGVWRNLSPLIKGILGVLALLTVIPAAAVVLAGSIHGFVGTFFKTPETESTKKFNGTKELLDTALTPLLKPPGN